MEAMSRISTISSRKLFPVVVEVCLDGVPRHWDELRCETQIVERLHRQYEVDTLQTLGTIALTTEYWGVAIGKGKNFIHRKVILLL